MISVAKNIVVVFRYIMKNSKGQVIENTIEGSPKCYLHGSSGIHSSLQVQFEGMKVGDSGVIYLKKEMVHSNEDFTFDVIIDGLRPASEDELMLGYPLMLDDLNCDSGCACYNSFKK